MNNFYFRSGISRLSTVFNSGNIHSIQKHVFRGLKKCYGGPRMDHYGLRTILYVNRHNNYNLMVSVSVFVAVPI